VPISFSDEQLSQIRTSGYQVPHRPRRLYLERLVQLLPDGFGDGDLHRACVLAQREVLVAGVAQCPLIPIAAFRA
jgi:hypothetical protein